MFIDLDAIFESNLETLTELSHHIFQETGSLVPMAILVSISDGKDPKYEGVPAGETVNFTLLLGDLMGGDPRGMLLELMRGLKYEAGKGDELDMVDEVGPILALLHHAEDPDQEARNMVNTLLSISGRHQKEIVVMGLKRMIREYDAIGALLSMDSYFKKFDIEDTEEVDLANISLANDAEAVDAHVFHLHAEHYNRVITKPYTVVDGRIVYDEDESMDIENDPGVQSRFSGLFATDAAN